MRLPPVAFGIALLLLLPVATAAEDVRDTDRVNEILEVIETPQLAPGESGNLRLLVTNPYANPMRNTTLTAEIFMYVTISERQPVDANWSAAFPQIANSSAPSRRELTMSIGTFPRGNLTTNFTIETSAEMPHGSVFSQATYFVRFRLTFDYDNGTEEAPYTMASQGYFPDGLWRQATNGTCTSGMCYGYVDLGLLGVDGILPDSSFGVKEPIPMWPFYALIGFMGIFLVLAFVFWVEENPASFPRIGRGWAIAKGKLREWTVFRRPRPRP